MKISIKIPKFKKGFKKGSAAINPNAYWNGILFVSAFLIALVFVAGFLLFRKVSQEPPLSVSSDRKAESIREEKINEALEYFKAREEKSQQIINSPAPIIDPSL